jgi:hypothetical protein
MNSTATLAHQCNSRSHRTYWQEYGINLPNIFLYALLGTRYATDGVRNFLHACIMHLTPVKQHRT